MIVATLFVASLSLPSGYTMPIEANCEGFSEPEFIELLDQIIEAETLYGLSGVQIAVYKDGVLIKNSAYGFTNNYYNVFEESGKNLLDTAKALPIEERTPVTQETLFDMASNTKMYATVFSMQKLVSDGLISLDTLIKDIYPEFTDYGNDNGWKDMITVGHVLSHYAGFAPDPQYHNENYDEDDGIPNGKNDLFSQDKTSTFEMIMKTPITTKPGTSWAYSDVGMMLAGFIVETLTGKDLDTYVKETFYEPLNLDRITFNPLRFGFNPSETSSAELHGNTRDGRISFKNVRTEIVTGEVHDEKAFYSMDGVSGHAGLFGTAQQVAYLAQAMFDGTLNGIEFFSQETIDEFVSPAALLTQTNGGWRRRSPNGAIGWYSKFAPVGVIGHTGWTGTNTFIDPFNKITVALFTNRTNTPIMGPGANTFYTANSNISSYGAVSEFIYRGLGLGDSMTPHEVLENMINTEIPSDLSSVTLAKRNVIRSLLHVLTIRSKTDSQAQSLLESDKIQSTIQELEKTYASDTRFLVVTKKLDLALESAKEINKDIYTTDSYAKLTEVIDESELLLLNDYTQEDIDDAVEKINLAISGLELLVNKDALIVLIEDIKNLDLSKYTKESGDKLDQA